MSVQRLVAAAAVLVFLTVTALAALTADSQPESAVGEPLPAPVTTTSEADFAAIVAAQTPTTPLSEEEQALTEMVLSAVAQTTIPQSSTTTVGPQTTTTTDTATDQPQPKAPATPTPTTAPAATSPAGNVAAGYQSGAEGEFVGLINSRRDAVGLASLSRSGSLDSHARESAKRMAEQGSISHSDIGALIPPWASVGENVGSGGSVSGIFNALAASAGHDANMLGDFTHIGVGVWRDEQGALWTAHVFAR